EQRAGDAQRNAGHAGRAGGKDAEEQTNDRCHDHRYDDDFQVRLDFRPEGRPVPTEVAQDTHTARSVSANPVTTLPESPPDTPQRAWRRKLCADRLRRSL